MHNSTIKILFASFFFKHRNFGVNSDKTLVNLLAFKCIEYILFYEHACGSVVQPKAGVLNHLLCHGPFESLVNPICLFSQKCI
jgi:hypothetical protein